MAEEKQPKMQLPRLLAAHPTKKTRKRKSETEMRSLKQQADTTRGKTRISIGIAFQRWRELKELQNLKSDATVAVFLLDSSYDKTNSSTPLKYGSMRPPPPPLSSICPESLFDRAQFWMDLFGDLRDSGNFNDSHEHKCLLRFCFSDVVQKDLDECAHLWNKHRIRRSRLASCPAGIPDELYLLPHRFGSRDCGFPVEDRELDSFPESRQRNPCADPDIEEYLHHTVEQNGLEQPRDWESASELCGRLKEIAGF